MSWLNISGNLSSLASNVTSFTREVLQDANNESYQQDKEVDSDDDSRTSNYQYDYYENNPSDVFQANEQLKHQLATVQDNLNLMNTELSTKNDEIYFLQQEINNLSENHDRHTKGLKQHLLEKDNEIEDFATRLQSLQTNHDEAMKKLITEKDMLELQLQEKNGGSSNDDGWSDDWSNNIDEVNDLKSQNDSLSNEVMMKEIILSSIEAKMQQISKKHVDVADFEAWLTEVLLNQGNETKPAGEIMQVLSEVTIPGYSGNLKDPKNFKEWLQNTLRENSLQQEKIDKLEKIISEIEMTMNKQSQTIYTITQFHQWFENQNTNKHRTDTKDADNDRLKQIESDIRDLDEEYENFEISNFQEWLQHVQGRIDDLEVELLTEQENREAEEQQRIVERVKLNDLFTEKENEIAMLKVELYNKSSTNSPDHVYEQENNNAPALMALHDQLNEANARCQGLQDELKCLQQRNDDLSVSQDELTDAINQLNNLKALSEEKENLQNQLLRSNKKIELLEKELSTEQDDNRKLQEELQNSNFYKEKLEEQMNEMNLQLNSSQSSNEVVAVLQGQLYQSVANCESLTNQLQTSENNQELSQQIYAKDNEINNLSSRLTSLQHIIEETVSKQGVNFDGALTEFPNFLPSFRNLDQLLDSLQSKNTEMASKCNELTEVNHAQVEQLSSLESERTVLVDTIKIVAAALDSLDLQDSDQRLLFDGQLASKEPTFYHTHMERFRSEVLKLQSDRDQLLKTNQVQNPLDAGDQTQIHSTNEVEEILKLKNELQECERQHGEEKLQLQMESDALRLEIADLEQNIANLKTSAQQSNSPSGGMKFGALKKKLKEAEENNALLLKENLNLKETAENNNDQSSLPNMKSILLTICAGLDELQITPDQENLVIDHALSSNDPAVYQKYMADVKQKMELLRQTEHDLRVQLERSSGNSEIYSNEDEKFEQVFEESISVESVQEMQSANMDGWEDSESWGSNFEEDSNRKLSVIEVLPNKRDGAKVPVQGRLQTKNDIVAEQTQERENYQKEISELKDKISTLEKTIESLKQSAAPAQATSGGGGGMKFGAMKRKIQELEKQKDNLVQENEELKGLIEKNNADECNSNEQIENLSKMLSDKSIECNHYHQESEQLKATLFGMQKDMQTIQGECYQLKVMLHDQQSQHYVPSTDAAFTTADVQNVSAATQQQQQEQLHNLSLRLTDKTEECERLQQQYEYLNAKVLELQNDTSDMELVREECKQLKAMLAGKEHQSRVDETIMMLQQESKQLKALLIEKDSEYQNLQKVLLEKENDISDMELLREECKQLKQMLVTTQQQGVNKPANAESQLEESYHQLEMTLAEKEEEIRQKNAMLIDVQNSNSDMELLREECKQLKVMLLEKNDGGQEAAKDNKYFHDLIEEKEKLITEKDSTIDHLKNSLCETELLYKQAIGESQNRTFPSANLSALDGTAGDFSENSFLVQVQQLEEFLKEKEQEIESQNIELQQKDKMIVEMQNTISDIELLHSECHALKAIIMEKENDISEIQNDLDSANDVLQSKNEALKSKSAECSAVQAQLLDLQVALDVKEREYGLLQEELTESMAQDENIHLLQTEYRNVEERLNATTSELNECRDKLFAMETHCERLKAYEAQYAELKTVLKEKEEALNSLRLQSSESSILESETVGILQNELNQLKSIVYERENQIVEVTSVLDRKTIELQNIYNESRETIQDLERKLKASQDCVEKLNGEIESSKELSNLRLQTENELKQEIERLEATINKLHENRKEYESIEKVLQDEREKFAAEKLYLTNQIEAQSKITAQVESRLLTVENEGASPEMENAEKQQSNEMIASNEVLQDHTPRECPTCSAYHTEKTEIAGLLADMKESLGLGYEQQGHVTIISDLRAVNYAIDQLNGRLTQSVSTRDELQSEIEALSKKLDQQTIDNESSFVKTTEDYEFQIKDLQSQIFELNEMQAEFRNLCADNQHKKQTLVELEARHVDITKKLEHERQKRAQESQLAAAHVVQLEEELSKIKAEYEKRIKESEATANDVVVSECERLREQLTKNSHSLLDKNKECDSLKLDVLQLEEQVNKLRGNEQKLMQCEKDMVMMKSLSEENVALKSTLEDYEAKFESGKMEKAFLDELIRKKGMLEQEKEELLFQLNQMSVKTQEQDVLLKHRDVQYREIEAKSTRELERLRDHLVTIEESHTKDILECQEREQRLQQELDESKQVLSRKSIILQDSSKQFQEHVGDLQDQLHVLISQRDTHELELSKCKQKIEHDAKAIYNLQSALEQLQKDKEDQYNYLVSISKRREKELEDKIHSLTEEQLQAQATMSEASLAIQGIDKMALELKQKENELQVNKEKMKELISTLKDRELQYSQMRQASDNKLDKSLIRNLVVKYFEATEDKRAAIVQVIGGLLGLSPEQIQRIGTGAVPSKVGGWISTVWSFTTPKKPEQPVQTPARKYDTEKSFSELFVKFLENESEVHQAAIDTASLTINNDPTTSSTIQMFTPATPDILAFHNNKNESLNSSQRIPAPGQEIPRVHTHHAQTTLKSLLS